MRFAKKVKARLWAEIRKMSERAGEFAKRRGADFSRKRKLDFEKLIRFLISMQSGTTAHELLKFFKFDAKSATCSAFYQQRQKLLLSAFMRLTVRFNSRFPFELWKRKYQLIACDGCEFNIARNPNDPDTFHPASGRSSRGFNMIHATALYDLLSKRYLDCEIQPGRKKNEFRAVCSLVDRHEHGGAPVFIGDRGFSCYNFFAHAKEKGVFFLVRAKDVNTKRLLGLQALPEHIDENVDILLTRTQSKKKRKRPELDSQYRYVCKKISFDYIERGSENEYPLSLRVVRAEITEGIFFNFVTNLPAGEVTVDEIKQWYRLRWGIETSFRDLKKTIGAANFHSKKIEYIEQEIWARLILFNFCAIIAARVVIQNNDRKYIYQVNFAMAIKICHHFIRLGEGEPPPDIESLISRYTLPVRPMRSYARLHNFQAPVSFCYRFS